MKLLINLIVITLIASYSLAATGQSGWQIFRKPQLEKPVALNGIIAKNSNLVSVFGNASISGTIKNREVSFISESGFSEDTLNGLVYGQAVSSRAGICVGYVNYDAGKTTLDWIEGGVEYTKTVSAQKDSLLIISTGKKVSQNILAGISLKYATSNLAEIKEASAYAVDIGIIYVYSNNLCFSSSLQNFGNSSSFLTCVDSLPKTFSAGAAYLVMADTTTHLGFGIDASYLLSENRTIPYIGFEYGREKMTFDLGYKMNVDEALVQLGFSFQINSFIDVNYIFVPARYLSNGHYFGLNSKF
ncbi:MAG: hypothetical protein A2252_04690 [Elusimicrobia bacterium RIFOXYA2_FULL_39_19]|nr:MAG: hypothetical protein A2252_04690 [Elusimicrobia bacterium RIFOXYA2_FULL_39_19]